MKPTDSKSFDFDAWMALATTDPRGFEQQRREVIERALEGVSPRLRERMRRLQWKIDMERRRCPNPQSACVHLFGMMWDRVYGENGLLDSLRMVSDPQSIPTRLPAPAAVISFTGRARRRG